MGSVNSNSNSRLAELPPDEIVFGRSDIMRRLKGTLERVAGANVSVVINGESGTGKEVIAKLIHLRSPWSAAPFVKVNCAAIPGALLETELFGYEKGAFTGATATKAGRVEMADGGTLLLDEIAEFQVELQAKLLQLLQDGVFSRVGGQESKQVKVRLICATNHNLQQEVRQGNFREDLFHRINGISLRLPALRERAEDVPVIADYLLEKYSEMFGTRVPGLTPRMHRSLQQHRWPGNIRELENVIRRYVILGTPEAITEQVEHCPAASLYFELPAAGSMSLRVLTQKLIREMEATVILNVLQLHNWNRRKSAETLDISYRALLYKIRNAGIRVMRHAKRVNGGGKKDLNPGLHSEECPTVNSTHHATVA
jgi:two-component system response regulator AtoC